MQPHRSLGGTAVEASLQQAGFDLGIPSGIALVETARPRRHPYETVLAQSAWNVVPPSEFRSRLVDYPARMWTRFLSRRAVARINLVRAKRVVCLTEAMAELCAPLSNHVEVAPVTVPLDFVRTSEPASPLPDGTMLVPGTVTWYKNPQAALDLFQASPGAWRRVLYAGRDDGSGCWRGVCEAARFRGIPVERQLMDRPTMMSACTTAAAVVVASKMESLSFSLAESLLLAPTVYASRIPAHLEVAGRLGREPHWIDRPVEGPRESAGPQNVEQEIAASWRALGHTLGLAQGRASVEGLG